eukprot:g9525.t1
MVDCTELETFQQNTVIYSEGDIGEKFYALITGEITITKVGPAGFKKVLNSPDVFGEGALLSENYNRTAMVKANNKVTLLSLTRQQFNKLKNSVADRTSLETIDETLEKNVAKYEKEDITREARKNNEKNGSGFEV